MLAQQRSVDRVGAILPCLCRGGGPRSAAAWWRGPSPRPEGPLHHASHGPPPPEIRGRNEETLMRLSCLLAAAASVALVAPVAAQSPPAQSAAQANQATRDFRALLDEHYRWVLSEAPTYATALGVRDYDDRLPDLSPEARERSVAQ